MNRISRSLTFGCLGLAAALAAFAVRAEEAKFEPRSLFADRRAHAKGDILTVVINELAAVSANARTRTDKGESASANLLQRDGEIQLAEVGFDTKFSGGGIIERSGSLLGRITVRIEGVDANGNFLISGEQLIAINNEKQRIVVQGAVRPDDIASDNSVPSWRVAGANIEIKGKGILARRQAPGILTRLLSLFGQ
jgi:flagellar L-ring protein precursor FlgH